MPLRRREMKKTTSNLFILPYFLWIFLFVLAPVVMIIFSIVFSTLKGSFHLKTTKSSLLRKIWPI